MAMPRELQMGASQGWLLAVLLLVGCQLCHILVVDLGSFQGRYQRRIDFVFRC
jgi:hypothetical protein